MSVCICVSDIRSDGENNFRSFRVKKIENMINNLITLMGPSLNSISAFFALTTFVPSHNTSSFHILYAGDSGFICLTLIYWIASTSCLLIDDIIPLKASLYYSLESHFWTLLHIKIKHIFPEGNYHAVGPICGYDCQFVFHIPFSISPVGSILALSAASWNILLIYYRPFKIPPMFWAHILFSFPS